MKPKVLDLFSGIAGFSVGLERAGFETVAFCEIEEFPKKVIKKNWPGVRIYDDITRAKFTENVDLVTAGFPCQDISLVGKGAGLSGERSGLFWYILRTLCMVGRPDALLENVAALLNRGMGTVLGAMASFGYDAEWHCIPASAVGAEHERDRVWIYAYSNCERELQQKGGEQDEREWIGNSSKKAVNADINCIRLQGRLQAGENKKDAGDIVPRLRLTEPPPQTISRDYWNYQPLLGRGVHGVPDRAHRIKALGNAVYPEIPKILGREIIKYMESKVGNNS